MHVLVIGDVHGDIDSMGYARELAIGHECEAIVQVGDFGLYWDGYGDDYMQQVYRMFGKTRMLYVLPGNHENYGVLSEKGWLTRHSPVMLPNKSGYYLPHGCRFKLGDSWCLAYGGAFSVDKEYRVEGKSWWPEEVSNQAQHDWAMHWNGRVDVVFSHDAPLWADIPVFGLRTKNTWPETGINRAKLQEVADKYHPKQWFHGHWHTSYTDTRVVDGEREKLTGLAHNMRPGFWMVVEL